MKYIFDQRDFDITCKRCAGVGRVCVKTNFDIAPDNAILRSLELFLVCRVCKHEVSLTKDQFLCEEL